MNFMSELKKAAEATKVSRDNCKNWEETQLKQVVIMGVCDNELVQLFITLAHTSSLDEVVEECYAYEVACNAVSPIMDPPTGRRATSKYSVQQPRRSVKTMRKKDTGPEH